MGGVVRKAFGGSDRKAKREAERIRAETAQREQMEQERKEKQLLSSELSAQQEAKRKVISTFFLGGADEDDQLGKKGKMGE